jgi:hypothetical protein
MRLSIAASWIQTKGRSSLSVVQYRGKDRNMLVCGNWITGKVVSLEMPVQIGPLVPIEVDYE